MTVFKYIGFLWDFLIGNQGSFFYSVIESMYHKRLCIQHFRWYCRRIEWQLKSLLKKLFRNCHNQIWKSRLIDQGRRIVDWNFHIELIILAQNHTAAVLFSSVKTRSSMQYNVSTLAWTRIERTDFSFSSLPPRIQL